MSFLDFCFSSNWEREREWYIKFGYQGEMAPKLLILFFNGVPLENLSSFTDFILFFYTGLKNLGSLVSQIFFCLQPGVNGYGSVCHEPCSKTNFLIIYFRWGEGVPTSVLGSQPIIWLLSSSPSGVRRPEVTKYQHLLISPLWPTFSLNGHFFDGFPLFIPTGG